MCDVVTVQTTGISVLEECMRVTRALVRMCVYFVMCVCTCLVVSMCLYVSLIKGYV